MTFAKVSINIINKARFCQVGDQVSQVKDQVGQGKGQELDNIIRNFFFNLKIGLKMLKEKFCILFDYVTKSMKFILLLKLFHCMPNI